MSPDTLGTVVASVLASIIAAGVTFWVARRADRTNREAQEIERQRIAAEQAKERDESATGNWVAVTQQLRETVDRQEARLVAQNAQLAELGSLTSAQGVTIAQQGRQIAELQKEQEHTRNAFQSAIRFINVLIARWPSTVIAVPAVPADLREHLDPKEQT